MTTEAHSTVSRAVTLTLGSTLMLASMHGLVRFLSSDMHPFMIVFFRNLFGLVAVMPLLLRAGVGSLKTQNPRLHMLRALVGVIAMLGWFYALSKVPIANATALSFSTTIFATLSAWLFLGEALRWRRSAAIVVGLIGVYVVLRPAAEGFNIFSILVLFTSIAWGLSLTIVKQLSKTESPTSIVSWMGITLVVLSFWPALSVWQTPTLEQLLWLFLVGALATAGHLLMTMAIQMTDTSLVMSVDFTRLIWTALIGAYFFSEVLDMWTFVGASIIFLAGWYIVFRESRMSHQSGQQQDTAG
ncbi:MAG: DMT family transporter [Granulosicoccus sp.]